MIELNYSPNFKDTTADVLLRSSDGVHFLLHSSRFCPNTVFNDMYELNHASGINEKQSAIELTEPAEILEIILPYLYNNEIPAFELKFPDCFEIVKCMDKYAIWRGLDEVVSAFRELHIEGLHNRNVDLETLFHAYTFGCMIEDKEFKEEVLNAMLIVDSRLIGVEKFLGKQTFEEVAGATLCYESMELRCNSTDLLRNAPDMAHYCDRSKACHTYRRKVRIQGVSNKGLLESAEEKALGIPEVETCQGCFQRTYNTQSSLKALKLRDKIESFKPVVRPTDFTAIASCITGKEFRTISTNFDIEVCGFILVSNDQIGFRVDESIASHFSVSAQQQSTATINLPESSDILELILPYLVSPRARSRYDLDSPILIPAVRAMSKYKIVRGIEAVASAIKAKEIQLFNTKVNDVQFSCNAYTFGVFTKDDKMIKRSEAGIFRPDLLTKHFQRVVEKQTFDNDAGYKLYVRWLDRRDRSYVQPLVAAMTVFLESGADSLQTEYYREKAVKYLSSYSDFSTHSELGEWCTKAKTVGIDSETYEFFFKAIDILKDTFEPVS